VLVIGLVGLLVIWWLSEGQQSDTPVEEAPEAELLPGDEQSLGETGLETPVEPATPATEPGAAETQAQPEADSASEAADEEPVPATEAQPAEEPAPAAAEPVGLQLRMVFTADSWVSISDATGRELAQGLIKQGRELTLDGRPPYRVFLGYAPGVTIYYRGEQFDHSAFVRGNETARFRVGSADDSEAR
jgi:cytoskeleton protein RodZ